MRVSIDTGSRLHLGFTNLGSDLGRCWGSLGVAIDRPSIGIVLEESDEFEVEGGDRDVVRGVVDRFADAFGVRPTVKITFRESITEHVGLGSGTQLALAIGTGLAAACGLDVDARELAAALRRGRRSGMGVAAFLAGGFVLDAGVRTDAPAFGVVPTVVWRHDVPADWCFVIAVPAGCNGLSGNRENGVFATLAPSVRISEEVCRITQLQLMPALVEHDIEAFGRALTAVDQRTGKYFTSSQGGLYSHAETTAIIAELLRLGAHGAGQSSWGPAVYAVAHASDAPTLRAATRDFLLERGWGDEVLVCHGRNTGARVQIEAETL